MAVKIANGAVGAVLLVSFAMSQGESVEICRCSPDPDGCGETCHVCVEGHDAAEVLVRVPMDCSCGHPEAPHLSSRTDSCQHESVTIGDLDKPTETVLRHRALTAERPSVSASAVVLRGDVGAALHAVRFKPPDFRRRDAYSVMASRLYPRS